MEEPVIVQENECDWEEWDDDTRGTVKWRTLISGDKTLTKGLTCGIAKIPAGLAKSVSLHKHSQVELYYILEGNGILTVNEKEYEVSAGTTVYIPENASHGLVNTGLSALRLIYIFPVDSFEEVKYVFPTEIG